MSRPSRVVATVAAVALIVLMTLTADPPWLYYVVADLLDPAVSGRTVERALNVVLFVPIGIVIGVWGRPVWLLGAFTGSVTIELLQFVLPRSPQLSDVITNTTGAILGHLLVVLWRRWRRRAPHDGAGPGDRDRDGGGERGTGREVDWSTQ